MFTGLIEAVGTLVERTPSPGGARVRIASAVAAELRPGDSIAVNGVCLTVTGADAATFCADAGPETLRVTTVGSLNPEALLNVERPLRPDGRLGGHFVQGHVDAVGRITGLRAEAGFHWLTVSFPPHLAPFIVEKGSIAVDGISLTVANLYADRFDVQLVPFTVAQTNMRGSKVGDLVNLETDMVAKYVVRAAELAGVALIPIRDRTGE